MENKKLLRIAIKERLYRRRFILPNAVTLGNMFCGFIACIYAAAAQYEKAVIAILIAIVLDGLDGRVARKFNATSKFGLELDSFSDLVSFGVAPALLMYHWCFRPLANEFGVLAVFVYCLCAASRLARFNISAENLKSFTGLPTPGAAVMVVSVVNVTPILVPSYLSLAMGTTLMIVMAYLMVSKIEFFSIKLLRMRTLGLFPRIVLGLLIWLVWYDSRYALLTLASFYVLSGPMGWMKKKPYPENGQTPEIAQ